MQPDGDLVLLKSGAEKLWSSGTAGKGATHVQMKAGGNLVLVGHRATVWETKTSGHRGARLVVQDDGNLVVYGADNSILWQSETRRGMGRRGGRPPSGDRGALPGSVPHGQDPPAHAHAPAGRGSRPRA